MRVRQMGAFVIMVAGIMVMVPACAGEQRGPRQSHNPVPTSPCEKKCDEAQEKAAEKCAGITAEKEREQCQTDTYEEAKSCKAACAKDPVEECKDKCDDKAAQEREKCKKMAPGPGQGKCYQAVQEQWASCYHDCEKLKK